MKNKKQEIKVFGIGLNKTGTSSLGKALKILGFMRHQTYNLEFTELWFNGDTSAIYSCIDKNNSFEDWPWPMMYKEIYNKYENAYFILTKRKSSEVWFKSLCKHADSSGPTPFRKMIYGYEMPHNFETEHIEFYERHNSEVIEFFKNHAPDRLLIMCFEEGDGWEKLCSFLDRPNPYIPFPAVGPANKKRVSTKMGILILSMRRRIRSIIKPLLYKYFY